MTEYASCCCCTLCIFFFFKQKTAYEMRISDWSSDVCSSDLAGEHREAGGAVAVQAPLGTAGGAGAVWQHAPVVQAHLQGRRGMSGLDRRQIGRASCRESVCQYV